MRKFHPAGETLQSRRQKIHGEFVPADVRQGERAVAKGLCASGTIFEELKVWRISPLGIEIAFTGQSDAKIFPVDKLNIKLGQQEIVRKVEMVADSMINEFGNKVVGYKFAVAEEDSKESACQSDEVLWSCHDSFVPTGSAVNKIRFNDWLYFRVLQISATRMKISTSMRNKMLIPGMGIDCKFSFPSGKNCSAKLVIKKSEVVSDRSGTYQCLDAEIVKPGDKFLEQVANYVFVYGHHDDCLPTPKNLAQDGLYLKSVAEAIEYDYVRNEEDFKQVCYLRSLAFRGVSGLGVVTSPEQMADVFDKRARILVARFRGTIVGTVRMCFHGPEDKFEEEQYCAFPSWFPERHLMVEGSRAATHPDFRKSDIFLNLLRYGMLITLQNGRHFIVQSTYSSLVPLYLRFGFRRAGVAVPHPVFPGQHLHLLIGDARAVLTAPKNSMQWIAFAPYIEKLIADDPSLRASPWSRGRIALYRSASPVVSLISSVQHFMQRRKFRRARKQKDNQATKASGVAP